MNLGQVKLQKGSPQTFQLTAKAPECTILINLNWRQSPQKVGFLSSFFGSKANAAAEVDLDLGCFYELNSGDAGVLDGLQFADGTGGPRDQQTAQGCYTQAPWIWHQGDDRTGAESEDGEFIQVNPQGYPQINRIIVYAMIYEGADDWKDTDAVVTIKAPGVADVVVELGRQSNTSPFCVLAELEFIGGDQVKVSKHVTFHEGHSDADDAYGWGFDWVSGSK